MRSPLCISSLSILAASIVSALAPVLRADQAADFDRMQQMAKNQQAMMLRQIQPLDKDHPTRMGIDLFSLRNEHGNMVLKTPLNSAFGGQLLKVKIGDTGDWAILNVMGGAAAAGHTVIPDFFSLTRTTFEAHKTETLMIQQARGGYLNITLQDQSATGIRTVQFQEQNPNLMAQSVGTCQLLIFQAPTGRPAAPVIWNSANFTALTLEHPVEVDTYLRPLLHQLGQDAAATPDAMVAFQLFSDRWSPDPAVIPKVNALVADLAGGNFHSRSHAQNQIAALGRDAVLVLIRLDHTKLTPEQNARVDKLIAPYQPVPPKEAEQLHSSLPFLLNCLYSDDTVIRNAAFARLVDLTKLKFDFDPDATAAVRVERIPLLLKQLIDAKLIPSNKQ